MKNTTVLFLITLLITTSQLQAQNLGLPKNPKVGKCYANSFDYNVKFEWKEVDCSKVQGKKTSRTKEQLIKKEQRKLKMIAYQKKLIRLDYDVEINGLLDRKTIEAHNKLIKIKKKEEKRKRRAEKKKNKIGIKL
ncbi:hypothetical protein [Lacinutrix himadriensis]|uniref:hypothetical protein n=1 Tax=Lacinutrix himadriensis TaxID=641549 RepID=UPI0006E36826|nr:hypothetical protein [Lacinutrix himadriensis]